MAFHEVQQGEHLSGIALDYGFPDFTPIWNHPQNAELKQKRENPHVLLPGDKLFVPDKTAKEYSRPADNQHTFEVLTTPLFYPIVVGLGFDPIWYGVLVVVSMEQGQLTPPVGLNLYVIAGMARDIPMSQIIKLSLIHI